MTKHEKLLLKALQKIADLNVSSCELYVAKADSIALDAIIAFEIAMEDSKALTLNP
jgi:hypothetical protein